MLDTALQHHIAVFDADIDLTRVEPRIIRHPLTHVLTDARVAAAPAARPLPGVGTRDQRRVACSAGAWSDLPAELGFAAAAPTRLDVPVVAAEVAPLERLHGSGGLADARDRVA